MDRNQRSLADEVKAAIAPAAAVGPASPGVIRAERVRSARNRFLPYVVVGGAVSCGYLSVVVTKKDDLAAVFGAAITAGIAAGMAVGWLLLGLFRRCVERWGAGRRRVDLAIVLLTVPAYAVAGWVSAWVGWVVGVALSRPTPEPPSPNAWGLLIAATIVIYPLSYAFARRDSDRPQNFTGALFAANREISEEPRSWMVLGDFLIVLAWFVGALFAVFGVAIGFQVIFPDIPVADVVEHWLLYAMFLGAWIGITVGGSAWTLRWVHRRGSGASDRSPMRDDQRSDVYQGPGCETGAVVLPAVALVGLISALVVGLTDVPRGVVVGLAGVVTGVAAWLGIWELFSRLHPRFSGGSGEIVKSILILAGPPLLALATVVLLAIRLRAE